MIGNSVEVRVLSIKAVCPCGASRFYPPHPPPYALRSRFACAGCGASAEYGVLLDQIGEQAMSEAQDSLARLRRRARGAGSSLR